MQPKSRQILRILWINTVAAVMAPLLVWVLSPRTTVASLLETFAFAFLHAQIIGTLASYSITKIERLLDRLHPVVDWFLFIVSSAAVGALGAVCADGGRGGRGHGRGPVSTGACVLPGLRARGENVIYRS